jgi:hypothetical protein
MLVENAASVDRRLQPISGENFGRGDLLVTGVEIAAQVPQCKPFALELQTRSVALALQGFRVRLAHSSVTKYPHNFLTNMAVFVKLHRRSFITNLKETIQYIDRKSLRLMRYRITQKR